MDKRLRDLERTFRETGSPLDECEYLAARLHAGCPRWGKLARFVERWYGSPLSPSPGPDRLASVQPAALREWYLLAGGRAERRGLYKILPLADLGRGRPGPRRRGTVELVTDGSGHGRWLVPTTPGTDDPVMIREDDEADEDELPWEPITLSQLLTAVVIRETIEAGARADQDGTGPLGRLREGIRGLALGHPSPIADWLRGLRLQPYDAPLMDGDCLLTDAAETLLVCGERGEQGWHPRALLALNVDAWAPVQGALDEEARRVEAARAEDRRTRDAEAAAQLAALGSAPTSAEELLAALEELEPGLSRLDRIFLMDFRARVRGRAVTERQKLEAARILRSRVAV